MRATRQQSARFTLHGDSFPNRASVVLALALIPVFAIAAPAQAIVTHSLSSTFGSGLNFPVGIAVDNSSTGLPGEVYVADLNNHRIAKFKAAGTSDGEISTASITGPNCAGAHGFVSPVYVATDPTNGDLLVSDNGATAVTAFAPSGECLFQINTSNSMPAGASVVGVAIDPNNGPDGTIYVANRTGSQINEFDGSTRALTGSFPVPPGNGNVNSLDSLAVDAAGHLYVVNWRPAEELFSPTEHGEVMEFDPLSGGAPLRAIDQTNTQAVAVDASDGQIFTEQNGPDTLDNPACGQGCAGNHFQHSAYNQIADFRSSGESSPAVTFGKDDLPVGPGNNAGYGLAVNESTDTIYLTDPGTYQVNAYTPSVTVPDVITGPASTANHESATLTGEVSPDTADGGTAVISCYFQYGTSTTYSGPGSGTVPCSPDPASTPPSSNFATQTSVTAEITNLEVRRAYHYRLVASSANDVLTYGGDQTVTTLPEPPTVDSTSVSGIGRTRATIESAINPGFGSTVYRLEYGTTTSYGLETVFGQPIAADGVDHVVSNQLSGLTPATTYHYRVRAVNFSGVTISSDESFSTTDVPEVGPTSAVAVTQTAATLTSEIKPHFSPTTYHFEYGAGSSYGIRTQESGSIGADQSTHPARAAISGLTAGTTYHYRVVATNATGVTAGPDQTFTTSSNSSVERPQTTRCKPGFVKKHGRCVRKSHGKKKHRKSVGKHG